MPRYFFDVREGAELYLDPEGIELADLRAAKAEARRALGDMANEAIRAADRTNIVIEIREGSGHRVVVAAVAHSDIHEV
jgi:hypothetical protein